MEKEGKLTPRPIQPQEMFNHFISKQMNAHNWNGICNFCIKNHQFGTSLPGVIEGMVHTQEVIEKLAANGSLGGITIMDYKYVNCFGKFSCCVINLGLASSNNLIDIWW